MKKQITIAFVVIMTMLHQQVNGQNNNNIDLTAGSSSKMFDLITTSLEPPQYATLDGMSNPQGLVVGGYWVAAAVITFAVTLGTLAINAGCKMSSNINSNRNWALTNLIGDETMLPTIEVPLLYNSALQASFMNKGITLQIQGSDTVAPRYWTTYYYVGISPITTSWMTVNGQPAISGVTIIASRYQNITPLINAPPYTPYQARQITTTAPIYFSGSFPGVAPCGQYLPTYCSCNTNEIISIDFNTPLVNNDPYNHPLNCDSPNFRGAVMTNTPPAKYWRILAMSR